MISESELRADMNVIDINGVGTGTVESREREGGISYPSTSNTFYCQKRGGKQSVVGN